MKLQKITQKRWFWPLVCAVSVVFGWWYLSIVTCAPLGGDDELINLQNYYYITHTSFAQSVLDYLGDLWEQFSLQNGRFRPFSSPPVRGLTSWFLGDLVGYRLYILAWTYADIVLTAWLVGKASRNKKLDCPSPGMTVELPAYRRKQIDIFYPDEIQRLAQMIMDEPTTTGIGILLTLNTGLRLGELCALQYKDIDLRNGVVHVRKTVQRIRSGDRTSLMVLPPKSDSARRTIPLPGDMAALLQKLVQSHPNGENYLLTGKNVPMEPRTMQYQYRALLKAAGIPYRNFHTLRHTYASRCVERGIDVKSLSEMLGHADVRTTLQVYVHSSLEHKMRVIQSICFLAPALAAEFAPSPSPSVFPETLQYQQLLAALSQMG